MTVRLALVLLCCMLAGCGARPQRQVIADTRAASRAAASMPDGPARAALYEAIGRSVLALTDNLPGLPSPTWSPAEIAADPEEFIEATAESAAKPPAYEAPPNTGPPRPGPSDILREIGNTMLRLGAWVGGIGSIVLLIAALGLGGSLLALPFVLPVVRLAASLGTASVVVGAAMSWLAAYLWAVVLVCVLAAAGVAWFHRKGLIRAWRKAVSPFSKV